ncbi:hypothetical protein D3C73_1246840 [compost metagenome]
MSANVAYVKGLMRYCTTPMDTALRTMVSSRTAVMAMMSAKTPAERIRRATSRPWRSGKFISSRTRSTGEPDAANSPRMRKADCPSGAVPTRVKPSRRPT